MSVHIGTLNCTRELVQPLPLPAGPELPFVLHDPRNGTSCTRQYRRFLLHVHLIGNVGTCLRPGVPIGVKRAHAESTQNSSPSFLCLLTHSVSPSTLEDPVVFLSPRRFLSASTPDSLW